MSSQSQAKRKKPPYGPMVTAHQISFPNQAPQPYYNEQEKQQIQSHQNYYKVVPKNKGKRAQKKEKPKSTDPDSESEEESSSSASSLSEFIPPAPSGSSQKTNNPPKKQPNMALQSNSHHLTAKDLEESKESKGLLSKIADTAKSVVGVEAHKPKLKNTRITIELPRDILTAFFLLRLPRDKSRGIDPKDLPKGQKELPSYWNDFSLYGKMCLWMTVLLPYTIQWFVLCVLVEDLVSTWDQLRERNVEDDFYYNTCAFAILFLYMWKDLASFYFSVYRYITYLQKRKGGITKNLTKAVAAAGDMVVAAADNITEDTPNDKIHRVHVPEESKDVSEAAKVVAEDVGTVVKFIEFRLGLLSVVFLYLGLTCYSLLNIPLQPSLVEKLEVSLSIFFVLEVDDWAYELFIAQANILDDDEFDVNIIVKKDRKGVVKKQQKHLAITLIVVIVSTMFFWLLGWAVNQFSA